MELEPVKNDMYYPHDIEQPFATGENILFEARQKFVSALLLDAGLKHTFQSHSIPIWINRENRDLHWRAPADVIREGDYDSVNAALEALDSGVYV